MTSEKKLLNGALSEDWVTFCRQATNDQLRAIFKRERDNGRMTYAEIARFIAEERGIIIKEDE